MIDHSKSAAFLIGVSKYNSEKDFPSFQQCRNNVVKLRELLIDELKFDEQNIFCYTENDMIEYLNREYIVGEINEKLSNLKYNFLFFYFTGHGFLNQDMVYLAFCDAKENVVVPVDSINGKEFIRYITRLNIDHKLIVLDCCYSRAILGHSLSGSAKAATESEIESMFLDTKGIAYFFSSDSFQQSYVRKEMDNTLFTSALINIMKGGSEGIRQNVLNINNFWKGVRSEFKRLLKTLDEKYPNIPYAKLQTPRTRIEDNIGEFPLVRNNAYKDKPVPPLPTFSKAFTEGDLDEYFKSKYEQFKPKLKYAFGAIIFIILIWLFMDIMDFRDAYKDMVKIPGGEYYIGRPLNTPFMEALEAGKDHLADNPYILTTQPLLYTSQEGFYISKYEVTNKEYRDFLNDLQSQGKNYRKHLPYLATLMQSRQDSLSSSVLNIVNKLMEDDRPVLGVSYEDALAYTNWKGVTLPDTYQWEIAARSGSDSLYLYPWGNDFEQGICNTGEKNRSQTLAVYNSEIGSTLRGIMGMIGNAEEWVLTDDSVSAEIRGGHFDSEGVIGGIIHNKNYREKVAENKKDFFYMGFRYVLPESRSRGEDVSGMVLFPAREYKIGYNTNSDIIDVFQWEDLKPSYLKYVFEYNQAERLSSVSSFYIDKYEVTFSQYNAFLKYLEQHPNFAEPGKTYDIPENILLSESLYQPNYPIVGVSWYGAAKYAEWVGKSLPTTKQMTLAMAGRQQHLYPWGNEWCAKCCNDENFEGVQKTVPVDSILQDPMNGMNSNSTLGVFHLTGNVAEWMNNGPRLEEDVYAYRMGGSWSVDCRIEGLSFVHFKTPKSKTYTYIGFRCVTPSPAGLLWKFYELF